jgi:hypothetical protein
LISWPIILCFSFTLESILKRRGWAVYPEGRSSSSSVSQHTYRPHSPWNAYSRHALEIGSQRVNVFFEEEHKEELNKKWQELQELNLDVIHKSQR